MELNLIEQHNSTPASSFHMGENRVIRAATLFAQGALLLQQESLDLLNLRHAARLRVICNGIQQLVPALQRLGRATKPAVVLEPITPQYVSAGDLASREVVL
jgi:hypothetical protein